MAEKEEISDLKVKVARIEERLLAAEDARDLARKTLSAWQAGSNEWRQALNDQKNEFVTFDKMIAFLTLEIAIVTLIVKFLR